MQLSTLPSSREAASHAFPPPPVIAARAATSLVPPPPGFESPPQKLQRLQAQALQCTPRCSLLHHCAHVSYFRSFLSRGVQAAAGAEGATDDKVEVVATAAEKEDEEAGAEAEPIFLGLRQNPQFLQSQRVQCAAEYLSWQ